MTQFTPPHSLRYVPALDGLRAVAVLMVFINHLGLMPGGVYGVDIFFVLSGYLITEVLANSRGQAGFLGTFYFKRFLRLFPPLALICAVVAAICWIFDGRPSIYADALSSILYTQSWTGALKDGFGFYLGHTWSLSVEEQFYLVWPVVWLFLVRFRDARVTFGLSLALLVFSYVYQFWMVHANLGYDRIYLAPDTRSQAILVGAVGSMASRMPGLPQRVVRVLASIPLLALPFAVFITYDIFWDVEHGLAVSVLTLMVILRVVIHGDSLDSRALSLRPLVGLGRISYGFYLWHLPIVYLLLHTYGMGVWTTAAFSFAASLAISTASFIWLERPALRLRSVVRPAVQVKAGIAAFVVSVVSIIGGLLYFQWDDVRFILSGKPLEVVNYGPRSYQIGERGPLQADGTLAMWVQMNGRPDMQSTAEIECYKTGITVVKNGMSIMLPKVFSSVPGKYSVKIHGKDGRQLVDPVVIEVLPPK
ncbi:acyltransferase [Achromobacter spanius]|uniref:acyltransferase family protein n=1 Tax=Achromobacter spanius TaxID=217203 RepID=UPI003207A35E